VRQRLYRVLGAMNWQKRTRLALAAFTIAFGLVVFFGIGSRRDTPVTGAVERADPTAVIESTGAIVTQAKGAKQDFRVEAKRQLTYAGGATKLETVRIIVTERAGRNFEVTGREAEVGEGQSKITVAGDVRLAVSDGLTARTNQATYDDGDGMLRAPGPVEFARDRMRGSGVGATYDRPRDVLWLLRDAVITVAPDQAGGGGMDIAASAAGLARRDGYARFERGARIVRGGQLIEAQTAMAHFADADRNRIELLELRGEARLSTATVGAAGSFQGMSATDIDLVYGSEGQALTQALLSGNARIAVAGRNGQVGRRITADTIDLRFGPDGATIVSITARERVEMEFAAEPASPARHVRARVMDGAGDPAGGLTGIKLSDAVEYREEPAKPGGAERSATARSLDLALQPGMATIDDAQFAGDVKFTEGGLTARADRARYRIGFGAIELTRPAPAAPRPVVTDGGTAIEADRIDLKLEGRHMIAEGDVRTVLGAARPSEDRASEARRPRLLKADAPVYVTARHLEYDGGRRHAVYTGASRLWQGQTAIQGETIVLDEGNGNLNARGGVRTSLNLDEAGSGPGSQVSSIASAEQLAYEDTTRRLAYVGKKTPQPVARGPAPPVSRSGSPPRPAAAPPGAGSSAMPVAGGPPVPPPVAGSPATSVARGNPPAPPASAPPPAAGATDTPAGALAHVTGPQGNLNAERVEMMLDQTGTGLERVEAYGAVTLRTQGAAATPGVPRSRVATGERLTYFALDERYLMSGTPVAIIEECRETIGKSLTFYRSTDTISVDGNEEIRTQTKTGGTCPEQQLE
jgi:LPS export ABC transporter protein LptC